MKKIQEALKERILILDGPMGTMIQTENLKEEDYRGDKFKSSNIPVSYTHLTLPTILLV